MDSDSLQKLKDHFDRALAEISNEELYAEFEKYRTERLERVTLPFGYRFLDKGEFICVGDLYSSGDGYWILYDGPEPRWTGEEDYKMARLTLS